MTSREQELIATLVRIRDIASAGHLLAMRHSIVVAINQVLAEPEPATDDRPKLTAECRRLEAERDRLIEACVVAEWQPENHIRYGRDGFRWRYGDQTGVFSEREHAIKAVRKLAAKGVS